MDHDELISELPQVERMTPPERIALARERRRAQLRKNVDRERELPPPRPRRPRLRFSADVALLDATGRADAAEVERLLVEGAQPDSHNDDGLTPLHQCAIDDNKEIMMLLLSHGANVNAQDTEQWTPLHAAACCAHIDVVKILIEHGANLLAVNADGNMPYDICDDEATLDAIESEMAARGITQAFIDEQRGAPEKSMLDDMKLLYKQGLQLDARQPDGSTFLHIAAANGYYDVAAFLLRTGVSPLARDNDLWQPVHAAACWAQPDLIELICEYGGDINAKTSTGEMPSDLCEDPTTRSVIQTMQQQEARRRRLAFGVRDSRRQSRKDGRQSGRGTNPIANRAQSSWRTGYEFLHGFEEVTKMSSLNAHNLYQLTLNTYELYKEFPATEYKELSKTLLKGWINQGKLYAANLNSTLSDLQKSIESCKPDDSGPAVIDLTSEKVQENITKAVNLLQAMRDRLVELENWYTSQYNRAGSRSSQQIDFAGLVIDMNLTGGAEGGTVKERPNENGSVVISQTPKRETEVVERERQRRLVLTKLSEVQPKYEPSIASVTTKTSFRSPTRVRKNSVTTVQSVTSSCSGTTFAQFKNFKKFMNEPISKEEQKAPATQVARVIPNQGIRIKEINLWQFSGENPEEFQNWWNLFDNVIGMRSDISPLIKLMHLKTYVTKEAKDVIDHLPLRDESYATAVRYLDRRFRFEGIYKDYAFEKLKELSTAKVPCNLRAYNSLFSKQMACYEQIRLKGNFDVSHMDLCLKPYSAMIKSKMLQHRIRLAKRTERPLDHEEFMEILDEFIQVYTVEQEPQESHAVNNIRETSENTTGSKSWKNSFKCRCCKGNGHKDHKCPQYPTVAARKAMVEKGNLVVNVQTGDGRNVFALLDPGATTTMLSDALADELQLKVLDTRTVQWNLAAGQTKTESSRIVKCILQGPKGMITIFSRTSAMVTHPLTTPVVSKEDGDAVRNFGFEPPIDFQGRQVLPDILLGMDCIWEILKPGNLHRNLPSGLFFTDSIFGVIISGSTTDGQPQLDVDQSVERQHQYNSLEQYYKAISSLEAIGINDSAESNFDDLQNQWAVENFHETTKIVAGRIRVQLPFREDGVLGGTNERLAFGRLKGIFQSDKTKPHLAKYHQIFLDQIEAGIIERVQDPGKSEGRVYYAPHQAVFKDSETTKLRIVFDYSSHQKGAKSLNEILIPGPVKLPNIAKVHLIARRQAVIVTADLEKAFHMVELDPSHRDVTRFYWVKDFNEPPIGKNICVYRFQRLPFGAGPSPWLLAEAIEYQMDHRFPSMSQHVRDGLYVDNQIFVTDTEDEAYELAVSSKAAFADVSMNLREYVSNRQSIIDRLPVEDHAKQLVNSKILGVKWNTATDMFSFVIDFTIPENVLTRRSILSAISGVYDPLGLISPFLLRAKHLVQQTWELDLDWDDQIPPDLTKEWEIILSDIHGHMVEVPRSCIDYRNIGMRSNTLVIFSDASGIGLCAAAYVVSTDSEGLISSRLLMARSRLTPKELSEMPRLELVAYQMAAKLSDFILENLGMEFQLIVLYSDSQIVLDQLRNGYSQKNFVYNRLKKINDTTREIVATGIPVQFKYVNTKDNPADLGTRGMGKSEQDWKRWLEGADWLMSEMTEWPTSEKDFTVNLEPEVVFVNTIEEIVSDKKSRKKKVVYDDPPFVPFSSAKSWDDLCEIVSENFLNMDKREQFMEYCKSTSDILSFIATDPISVRLEIERFILREHQRICGIPQGGDKRDFIKDQYGLVRIRGRLGKKSEYADLSAEYPLLIKRGHPLVELLAIKCHEDCKHGMFRDTLANLWSKYVVSAATSLVRQVVRKCLTCRKHHARIYNYPRSPQLPVERVEIRRPFEHIGLDYCGPFNVINDHDSSSNGSVVKVWVSVITCFATRGIYLTTISSLDTKEFVFMFTDFVNKKGCPSYVLCDNQRSFVLGADILKELYQEASEIPEAAENFYATEDYLETLTGDESFQDFLKKKLIRWEFITPLSPWKAGIYERMVGKFKVALYKAAPPEETMSFRIFQNLISQAESSINDRPLVCPTPGLEYITPRMLMEPMAAKPVFMVNPNMEDDDFAGYSLNTRRAVNEWLSKAAKKSDRWFKIWNSDWLNELRMRPVVGPPTGKQSLLEPRVGDAVLLVDDKLPRRQWSLGEVTDLVFSEDGLVRSVYVSYIDFETGSKRRALRSTGRLACLEIFDEERLELQNEDSGKTVNDDEEFSNQPNSMEVTAESRQETQIRKRITPHGQRKETVAIRKNPGRAAKSEADKKLLELAEKRRI